MNLSDSKIKEICERHNYTSFWEIFDYMKLASYDEVEALMIASGLFYGDIWGRVINAAKATDNTQMTFASGMTYSVAVGLNGTYNYTVGIDTARIPDEMFIEVFLITDKGHSSHMPIYRAYVETRKYERVPELEEHIKSVKIQLTTELAMKLFNEGYNKLK